MTLSTQILHETATFYTKRCMTPSSLTTLKSHKACSEHLLEYINYTCYVGQLLLWQQDNLRHGNRRHLRGGSMCLCLQRETKNTL